VENERNPLCGTHPKLENSTAYFKSMPIAFNAIKMHIFELGLKQFSDKPQIFL
jgi:hypothetical protein